MPAFNIAIDGAAMIPNNILTIAHFISSGLHPKHPNKRRRDRLSMRSATVSTRIERHHIVTGGDDVGLFASVIAGFEGGSIAQLIASDKRIAGINHYISAHECRT
jgi:hypothetical protein